MPVTLSPSNRCEFCKSETVGYVETRVGEPKPIPVCSRCWSVEVFEEDLPPGSRAVVVDRKDDY